MIAVVFDVTDEASLNLCEKWIKLAQPLFTNNGLKGMQYSVVQQFQITILTLCRNSEDVSVEDM